MIDDTQLEKLIKITLLFSFSIFESFSLKYFPVFSIKKQNKLKIKCSMQNKKNLSNFTTKSNTYHIVLEYLKLNKC